MNFLIYFYRNPSTVSAAKYFHQPHRQVTKCVWPCDVILHHTMSGCGHQLYFPHCHICLLSCTKDAELCSCSDIYRCQEGSAFHDLLAIMSPQVVTRSGQRSILFLRKQDSVNKQSYSCANWIFRPKHRRSRWQWFHHYLFTYRCPMRSFNVIIQPYFVSES